MDDKVRIYPGLQVAFSKRDLERRKTMWIVQSNELLKAAVKYSPIEQHWITHCDPFEGAWSKNLITLSGRHLSNEKIEVVQAA